MADQVFAAALADAKQNLPKIADELDPEKYGIVLSVSGPGKHTTIIHYFIRPLLVFITMLIAFFQ
jgi:hypothetical protein